MSEQVEQSRSAALVGRTIAAVQAIKTELGGEELVVSMTDGTRWNIAPASTSDPWTWVVVTQEEG